MNLKTSKRSIPNPNKISKVEQEFIYTKSAEKKEDQEIKDNYKGRMISMSDSFYSQLNSYLKAHPTEGNRSGFIVRVVAEYINNKKE